MTPVYKLSTSSLRSRTSYGSMLAGNTAYTIPGDYFSIATVTVGSGGSSTVTFSSIPSTYTHLQIRVTEQTSVFDKWRSIQFNGDTTTSNYTLHAIYGNGSTVGSDWYSTGNDWYWYEAVNNHSTTSMGGYIIDILDYSSTSKSKTMRWIGGHDNNGSGTSAFISKLWKNTAAINQIDFKVSSATFAQNSSFALYGIRTV